MARRLSITTRRESITAVGEQYRRSTRTGERPILDEFLNLIGYHRRHAICVLGREAQPPEGNAVATPALQR